MKMAHDFIQDRSTEQPTGLRHVRHALADALEKAAMRSPLDADLLALAKLVRK